MDKSEGSELEAIMVIGAGIAGCQLALDLANSGLKVYLVEDYSAIAGTKAQLDKSFPIQDCSTCIFAPKLMGVDEHPNIELITNAEITTLEGNPGNFKATINQKAKYVFDDKSLGYTECDKECPIKVSSESSEITSNEDSIYLQFPQFGSLKVLMDKRGIPPCENACPARIDSQGYISLISKGKYQEALDLIRERCPLPSTIGRVCPHPCEDACNRGEVDEPINVCGLKRFVSDHVRDNIEEKIEFLEEKKEKKVAVIGSGPSGLTVAFHLARRGYQVTIFEREPVVGGMLRLGVPDYRLPPDVLNADIEHIKSYGVEIKTNSPVGPPGPSIKDLRKGFDAVYIGVGLPNSRRLNIEGKDLENVIYGIEFLKACNLGEIINIGKRVLVIGGGDVAFDVARTALRKGAKKVQMVMLESEDIIPAHPWEVEEAKEEGIIINLSRGPKRFIGKDGKVTGLETLLCSSVFDDDGHFNPVLEACTEVVFKGDMAIVTIGQTADLAFLDKGINVGRGIEVDRNTFQTTMPGVFAGGEVVIGPGSAIEAMATGNKVAVIIDKYLKGEDISDLKEIIPDYKEEEIVRIEDIGELERISHESRKNLKLNAPKKRKKNFEEFTLGMDEKTALEEANRCLSCGICSECFDCVKSCLASVIGHEQTDETISINVGAVILAPGNAWLSCYDLRKKTHHRWKVVTPIVKIDDELCMGCRTCEWNCPFDAIEVQSTELGRRAVFIPSVCRGCGICGAGCPRNAISIKDFTNTQMFQQIREISEKMLEKGG